MMKLIQFVVIGLLVLVSSAARAVFEPLLEGGEWSAETGVEYRYFKDPGEFGQAQNAVALRLGAEYFTTRCCYCRD